MTWRYKITGPLSTFDVCDVSPVTSTAAQISAEGMLLSSELCYSINSTFSNAQIIAQVTAQSRYLFKTVKYAITGTI